MTRKCKATNAAGKPCGMQPLVGARLCLAHSKKARGAAQAARKKGGRRRGHQKTRAAASPLPDSAPSWRDLLSVGQVDEAIRYAALEVIDGRMGAREGAAAARLLQLARAGAEQRAKAKLRSRARSKAGVNVDAAEALSLAVAHLNEVMAAAKNDKGMDPAERRAQVIAAAAALGKLSDPARQIAELSFELRQAHEDIAELEERVGANQEPPANPSGAEGPTEH